MKSFKKLKNIVVSFEGMNKTAIITPIRHVFQLLDEMFPNIYRKTIKDNSNDPD